MREVVDVYLLVWHPAGQDALVLQVRDQGDLTEDVVVFFFLLFYYYLDSVVWFPEVYVLDLGFCCAEGKLRVVKTALSQYLENFSLLAHLLVLTMDIIRKSMIVMQFTFKAHWLAGKLWQSRTDRHDQHDR